MKISLNWLKQYTTIKGSVEELVERIGSQLGEVEEVIDLGKRYKGIVVAKVVSCEKHPEADRLSVCLLDDGNVTKGVVRNNEGLIQVVCGAPNVRAGLLVAWIPPGSIVPETYDGEQFKLDVRPLRGVDSNGMIASQKELAIGENHSGILEIDVSANPGDSFAATYELNDFIIEIENKMFTHRPDCFGLLGVAREIAGIQHIAFESPEWYLNAFKLAQSDKQLPLTIKNEVPELVPRFMALTIAGVKVSTSPVLMQSYLARLGIRPINNIVDITNYVMLMTGQPLHAYDYDKVMAQDKNAEEATIIARLTKPGEKVVLLNDQVVTPHPQAVVIASKEKLLGIGGVIGGTETAVDKNTTNVILECATFDMYSIRKTSMEHGLFTDAVMRFNKGQSPLQNDKIIAYAASLITELTGGDVVGVHDKHKPLPSLPEVKVSAQFINGRLGAELTSEKMAQLLLNVELKVEDKKGTLRIVAPFWRTDIEIPEDIVEEVGRLYGYDHLPLRLPKRDIQPAKKNNMLALKTKIRNILSSAGANEILSYSFVSDDLITRSGQDISRAYQIANALSPELQRYRLSLTPSLLSKVHQNVKLGYDEFALFEIGKSHDKEYVDKKTKLPEELEGVAFIWTSITNAEYAPYYQARAYLQVLAYKLGIDLEVSRGNKDSSFQVDQPFNPERSAHVVGKKSKKIIGVIGEYKASVKQAFKLPDNTAGFELYSEFLLNGNLVDYKPLSKYPSVKQDISFRVNSTVMYAELYEVIESALNKAKITEGLDFKLSPLDIYQDKNSKNQKHVAFHLTISHPKRTLVTDEVNRLLSVVASKAHDTLKAERL